MIERLKRWWHKGTVGRQENVTAEKDVSMAEELHKITKDLPELRETERLLRESQATSQEASVRLKSYRKRMESIATARAETAKRLEMMGGERGK